MLYDFSHVLDLINEDIDVDKLLEPKYVAGVHFDSYAAGYIFGDTRAWIKYFPVKCKELKDYLPNRGWPCKFVIDNVEYQGYGWCDTGFAYRLDTTQNCKNVTSYKTVQKISNV